MHNGVRNIFVYVIIIAATLSQSAMAMEVSVRAEQPQKISEFIKKLYAAVPDNSLLKFLRETLENRCFDQDEMEELFIDSLYPDVSKSWCLYIVNMLLQKHDDLKALRSEVAKVLFKKEELICSSDSNELIIGLLLGGDPNINYRKGKAWGAFTVLHLAASNDPKKTALLLSAGANAHSLDEYGNTPLHSACNYMNCETAELLLKKGASLSAKNKASLTPKEQAEETQKLQNSDSFDKLLEVVLKYENGFPSDENKFFSPTIKEEPLSRSPRNLNSSGSLRRRSRREKKTRIRMKSLEELNQEINSDL